MREEGTNIKNPSYVRFKYDPTAVASAASGYVASYANLLGQSDSIYFENYEMAHFRLLGDVNYLPYGRSYLEPGRKNLQANDLNGRCDDDTPYCTCPG